MAPMPRSDHVNHTTVEDIPEGEVVTDTFLLLGSPAIILFDSRASHDFMSSMCATRAKLSLIVAKSSYMISTHLIVLDGQGIDVILGMSWMELHKAILDIAKWLVYLDSLIYGKDTLHLPVVVCIKASVHHTVAKSMEEIPVVREFPDVFPDYLLGMPPEIAIEFKIELQPGTTLITKSTYKMT
jgi:hypothetical protein